MPFYRAISLSLYFENPLVPNSSASFWKINQFPDLVWFHLLHFLFHCMNLFFLTRAIQSIINISWLILILWSNHKSFPFNSKRRRGILWRLVHRMGVCTLCTSFPIMLPLGLDNDDVVSLCGCKWEWVEFNSSLLILLPLGRTPLISLYWSKVSNRSNLHLFRPS